jgi:hypothetical protein
VDRRIGSLIVTRVALALAAVLALLAPAMAHASAAGILDRPGGRYLVYLADAGEQNELTVVQTGAAAYELRDPGAQIRAGDGCAAGADPHVVTCVDPADRTLVVQTLDLDDTVVLQTQPSPTPPSVGFILRERGFNVGFNVLGGEGNDRLIGGDSDDELDGEEGDDVVQGGDGDDQLTGDWPRLHGSDPATPPGSNRVDGGPGDDILGAGPGPDELAGGRGEDALRYDFDAFEFGPRVVERPPPPLRVTFDGRANDGLSGRRNDNVARGTENAVVIGAGKLGVLDGAYYVARLRFSSLGLKTLAAFHVLPTSGRGAVLRRAVLSGSDYRLVSRQRLTAVRLRGGSFSRCRANGATATASRRLSRRIIRRLLATVRGIFRVNARYLSLTVHGTTFEVQDRCDGSLVRVRSGVVTVRLRGGRRVRLRAGDRLFAPA